MKLFSEILLHIKGSSGRRDERSSTVSMLEPQSLRQLILVAGDENHQHELSENSGDGPLLAVSDYGTYLATFQMSLVCSCGHQVLRRWRALY